MLNKLLPVICLMLLVGAGCNGDDNSKDGALEADGPVKKTDGPIKKSDGPVKKTDGPIKKTDGPIKKSDGPIKKTDGPIKKTDGPVVTPDVTKPKQDKALTPDTGGKVPYSGSFPKTGSGYLSGTLTVDGYTRKVALYRPSGLGAKPPMLITLHGTGGDAKYMIQSSNAKDLADQKKVLIASPQARKMTKGDWDNHYKNDVYWETYPNTKLATNPDLRLLAAIMQEAQKAYNVDPKRIYVLGHSNGGFFAILAAMTLQDQIAAFVSNSAGLVRCASTGSCTFKGTGKSCSALSKESGWCACSGVDKPGPVATSGRKVPGYLVHSNNDKVVSIYYTCALQSRMKALGYTTSMNIFSDGHSMPYLLAVTAWKWLSAYKAP